MAKLRVRLIPGEERLDTREKVVNDSLTDVSIPPRNAERNCNTQEKDQDQFHSTEAIPSSTEYVRPS